MSALIEKRGRLDGERAALLKRADELSAAIKAVDVAIHQFDPDFNLGTIRRIRPVVRNDLLTGGEGSRLVLEALRTHPDGLTLAQIVDVVADLAGLELDSVDRRKLRGIVSNVLKGLDRRGRINRNTARFGASSWRTVPPATL